jgi:hypothetical protein
MEVSGQLHAPAALPPGKEPIGKEAGWVPELLWSTKSYRSQNHETVRNVLAGVRTSRNVVKYDMLLALD